MHTKSVLNHSDVEKIIAACRDEAMCNKWAVTIVVVDDGAHPLGMLRLDGCPQISAYIASDKARTAALGQRESKVYEDMITAGRTAFLSAPLNSMLEGGVPIIVDGKVIGAVGVSGVKSEQDVQVAKAGIATVKP